MHLKTKTRLELPVASRIANGSLQLVGVARDASMTFSAYERITGNNIPVETKQGVQAVSILPLWVPQI